MNYFTKKEQIVIMIIVLSVLMVGGIKVFLMGPSIDKKVSQELSNTIELEEDPIFQETFVKEEESDIIMVHVDGEVYNPGLVILKQGDRVTDAIELAGGLKKEADMDQINLAKKLSDEEKIYVPKIGEEVKEEILGISINTGGSSAMVNINSCAKEALMTLPGIGDVIADRILAYRSETPFKSVEEIKNVSGIGEKKFEGIKDMIICN